MNEILVWIKSLFTSYGAINVLFMVIIIVATNFIKKPIVNKAENFVESAKKHGYDIDKSVITSNIIYIPFGLALILYALYALILAKFRFAEVAWDTVLANAALYSVIAQSLYNIGKDKIKSLLNKGKYKDAKKAIAEADNSKKTQDDLIEPELDSIETVEIPVSEEGLPIADTDTGKTE